MQHGGSVIYMRNTYKWLEETTSTNKSTVAAPKYRLKRRSSKQYFPDSRNLPSASFGRKRERGWQIEDLKN